MYKRQATQSEVAEHMEHWSRQLHQRSTLNRAHRAVPILEQDIRVYDYIAHFGDDQQYINSLIGAKMAAVARPAILCGV